MGIEDELGNRIEIPDNVIAAVEAAMIGNLSSLPDQIKAANGSVRALPDFKKSVPILIDYAIRSLVYARRGCLNTRINAAQQPRTTAGAAKVNLLANATAEEQVVNSLFNLMLGGKRLGDFTREDCDSFAETFHERARGYTRDAKMLEWCGKFVTGNERVEDKVNHAALVKYHEKLLRGSAEK
jgi:hypothetical protein